MSEGGDEAMCGSLHGGNCTPSSLAKSFRVPPDVAAVVMTSGGGCLWRLQRESQ